MQRLLIPIGALDLDVAAYKMYFVGSNATAVLQVLVCFVHDDVS